MKLVTAIITIQLDDCEDAFEAINCRATILSFEETETFTIPEGFRLARMNDNWKSLDQL